MNFKSALFYQLIFLSAFINQASGQKISTIDSSKVISLRIDPSNAKGAKVSEVFKNVKFIPLETTKESLFGNIDILEVCPGYFVIYDFDTNSILVFESNGRFHVKITEKDFDDSSGKPNETALYNFKIKNERNKPVILVEFANNNYVFDLHGKRLEKKPIVKMINKHKFLIEWPFENGITLFKNYQDPKDSMVYELALSRNQTVFAKAFPKDLSYFKNNFQLGNANPVNNPTKDGFFFLRTYDYKIYKANYDGDLELKFIEVIT